MTFKKSPPHPDFTRRQECGRSSELVILTRRGGLKDIRPPSGLLKLGCALQPASRRTSTYPVAPCPAAYFCLVPCPERTVSFASPCTAAPRVSVLRARRSRLHRAEIRLAARPARARELLFMQGPLFSKASTSGRSVCPHARSGNIALSSSSWSCRCRLNPTWPGGAPSRQAQLLSWCTGARHPSRHQP